MQVSTYVKEAIDESVLYSNLDHKPDVATQFCGSEALEAFEASLDVSFFNVINQVCGYYQLKRFAATCNEALKLSFVEDATEYRCSEDPQVRLARYVIRLRRSRASLVFLTKFASYLRRAKAIVSAYHLDALFKQDTPLDLNAIGEFALEHANTMLDARGVLACTSLPFARAHTTLRARISCRALHTNQPDLSLSPWRHILLDPAWREPHDGA